MEKFDEWLERVTGGKSHRAIASDLGIPNTALSRWLRNEHIPAERVIEIARFYKASSLDGLLAAGYLTSDDIITGATHEALRHASTRELTEELLRRQIVDEIRAREAEGTLPPDAEAARAVLREVRGTGE